MSAKSVSILAIAIVMLSACGKSENETALETAVQYARNAVGKPNAPVWDEMVCYYDTKDKEPWMVTGYVNGGKGQQLFLVEIGLDGKPNGEVDLKPLAQTADASEVGYWIGVESYRKAKNGEPCGAWKEIISTSSSTYWHAIDDGLDASAARKKVYEDQREMQKIMETK